MSIDSDGNKVPDKQLVTQSQKEGEQPGSSLSTMNSNKKVVPKNQLLKRKLRERQESHTKEALTINVPPTKVSGPSYEEKMAKF
jgi:hypothetical protein